MANEALRVGRLSLIKSLPEHAERIADNMRKPDVRECYIHNLTPLEALTEPMVIQCSYLHCDLTRRRLGCVGAYYRRYPRTHLAAWPYVYNFRPFLRGCRPTIELLQGHYASVENFVPVDHHDTIMWLSWCGFTFDENMYEIHSHTFMRFERCAVDKNDGIGELSRPVMH